VSEVISTKYKNLDFFKQRKIKNQVETVIAEVVEPILPFLSQEKISEDKQRRLIKTCVEELRPLTKTPDLLFKGSLNGQKIFDDLYVDRSLPTVVIDDGLTDIYTILFPHIATLICKIPSVVKDWESEAWSESYRRFDELTTQLKTIFEKVDELATSSSKLADSTLKIVRQKLTQKIELRELDLTGLRSENVTSGKFENFFVHPEIKKIQEQDDKKLGNVVGTNDESFKLFAINNNKTIITGQPGAGKSTWAKWLQREALSPKWDGICIRVELRNLLNKSLPLPSYQDIIRTEVGQHLSEDITSERIRKWVEGKQIIFILDGFDEIRHDARDLVYDWINALLLVLEKCPIILTSRPITTDHLERLQSSFRFWNIEPFDQERIIDYIQRWYQYTPLLQDKSREIDASELASSWLNDPTLGFLTGNPLLLSTLLTVHHLDGSLPNGRSKLYQRYVDGMLGVWDSRRTVNATSIELSLEEKRQLMQGLALKMFLREEEQIEESTALEIMKQLLSKMKKTFSEEDVLSSLRERSGLIIGPGIYSFVHKSLAEYFVAECVFQGDQRDEFGHRIDRLCLFEHRNDDKWNTVIFLWAGLAPIVDVESLIEQCIEIQQWDLAYGIIHDQYDRFSAESVRMFLLKIIKGDIKIPNLIHYACSSSRIFAQQDNDNDNDNDMNKTFIIRNLQRSLVTFRQLLEKCVDDNLIQWSDNVENGMKDQLWIACSTPTKNIDNWRNFLQSSCQDNSLSRYLILWSMEYSLSNALNIKNTVENYRNICSQTRELIPIALISLGIDIVSINVHFTKTGKINDPVFIEIIAVLPDDPIEYNDNEIKNILVGTRDWKTRYNHIGDLLITFTKQMKQLAQQGILEQDSRYEKALIFVENLRDYRDSITSPEMDLNL
jgi:hypothetical protein